MYAAVYLGFFSLVERSGYAAIASWAEGLSGFLFRLWSFHLGKQGEPSPLGWRYAAPRGSNASPDIVRLADTTGVTVAGGMGLYASPRTLVRDCCREKRYLLFSVPSAASVAASAFP